MTELTPLHFENPRYSLIVGTGGIGSGTFFLLEGNETLARSESRTGRQLACRDYRRLHTALHYVAVLMGAASGLFEVYPLGIVGDDDRGWGLLAEMDSVGMMTGGVAVTGKAATPFSVRFRYPDSTGGDITASNGAGSLMTAAAVAAFFKGLGPGGSGIALALPEVPLEARIALLLEGRKRGWLNAASFTEAEAAGFAALGGPALADLLALTAAEAAAFVSADAAGESPEDIANRCMDALARQNGAAMLLVSAGARGIWAGMGGRVERIAPMYAGEPAGADDALAAGVLAGLACGLPFLKGDGAAPMDSAAELGALLASLSAMSPDTIHWGADARALKEHAARRSLMLSARFRALLPG
jgi:sugar/nucleoside kinase (ribokinase family)